MHLITQKKVAIKVIAKPENCTDPYSEVSEIQLRYARLPSHCEGLTKMIEYLEDAHYFYQVTAFMNYRTLDDLMRKQSIEYIPEV